MDMDMSGSNSTNSTMSSVMMVFHTGFGDAVFSTSWVPETPAAYFGTWVFIFFLAVISRSLLAWKAVLESKWFNKYASTAIVVSSHDDGKVKVVSGGKNVLLWHTFVDIPRSLLQFVSSGVQYLLMIIVMTMNVGYFLAVLAGIFFGELFFGRFIHSGHVKKTEGASIDQ